MLNCPALQCWEGSVLTTEAFRPVVNLFHSRLIVAVDWFRTCDFGELMRVTDDDLLPKSESNLQQTELCDCC